jgi:hypothetical protein
MCIRLRQKPARLSEKLLTIGNALGLSQTEVAERLNVEGMIVASQRPFGSISFVAVFPGLVKCCPRAAG